MLHRSNILPHPRVPEIALLPHCTTENLTRRFPLRSGPPRPLANPPRPPFLGRAQCLAQLVGPSVTRETVAIDGEETKIYRYLIRTFDFTELDGKEKWTAYKFTKNVYDAWVPEHLQRISSAVNQIPEGINFNVSQSSELHG